MMWLSVFLKRIMYVMYDEMNEYRAKRWNIILLGLGGSVTKGNAVSVGRSRGAQ